MSESQKAGVLGSPIAFHSPQLHLAAYRALGLHDWTYERRMRCGRDCQMVGGFGRVGRCFPVTMQAKFARPAVRRRAHARTLSVRPTPWFGRRMAGGPTSTILSTGWRGVGGGCWTLVRGVAPATREKLAELGSPTSPWWRATRTRRPGWVDLGFTGRRGDGCVRQRWVGRCGGRRGSAGQHHSSGVAAKCCGAIRDQCCWTPIYDP